MDFTYGPGVASGTHSPGPDIDMEFPQNSQKLHTFAYRNVPDDVSIVLLPGPPGVVFVFRSVPETFLWSFTPGHSGKWFWEFCGNFRMLGSLTLLGKSALGHTKKSRLSSNL